MKRIITIIVCIAAVLLLLAALSGCGDNNEAKKWVNPKLNEYTPTKVRMIGKGEASSGFKVAFFPPEKTDGIKAYLVGFSTREFDEVYDCLCAFDYDGLAALDKPVNRLYFITDITYADGVGNTLNTDQLDIVTGDDFTVPGTHYFYVASVGENGLLGLERAVQTYTVSPVAGELAFTRDGNNVIGSFVSYPDTGIQNNYVFVSKKGLVEMKSAVSKLTPAELGAKADGNCALAFANAAKTDFRFSLDNMKDFDGVEIASDRDCIYYVYVLSCDDKKVIGIDYCDTRFITPDSLNAPSGVIGDGKGTVFPNGGAASIGGGRDSIISVSQAMFSDFPDKPRIAVIGASSGRESEICSYFYLDDSSVASFEHRFTDAGFTPVYIPLTTNNRDTIGNDPYFAALVASCQAVYFTGGDQSDGMYSLFNQDGSFNAIGNAVIGVYQNGGLLSGTSAGAHVLGNICFQDADPYVAMEANSPAHADISASPVTGVPNGVYYDGIPCVLDAAGASVVFDSHFGARGRLGRLAVMLSATGAHYGVGLDEATGIAISDGVGMVYGKGAVIVLDTAGADFGGGQQFFADSVRLYILSAGDKFDFTEGTLIPASSKTSNAGNLPLYETDDLLGSGSAETLTLLHFGCSGEKDISCKTGEFTFSFTKTDDFVCYSSERNYSYAALSSLSQTACGAILMTIQK